MDLKVCPSDSVLDLLRHGDSRQAMRFYRQEGATTSDIDVLGAVNSIAHSRGISIDDSLTELRVGSPPLLSPCLQPAVHQPLRQSIGDSRWTLWCRRLAVAGGGLFILGFILLTPFGAVGSDWIPLLMVVGGLGLTAWTVGLVGPHVFGARRGTPPQSPRYGTRAGLFLLAAIIGPVLFLVGFVMVVLLLSASLLVAYYLGGSLMVTGLISTVSGLVGAPICFVLWVAQSFENRAR